MPSLPPSSQSTRIENFRFASNEAKFDLDGRTVQLHGPDQAPSVSAFRALYDFAEADYRAGATAPRPGWFSRLRSWIGRILGHRASPRDAGPSIDPPAPAVQPAALPARAAPRARHQPAPGAAPVAVRDNAAAKAEHSQPALRAIFADRDGVHVIWQAPARSQSKSLELTYALDSTMAQRLQQCYGRLSELGYKVVGLEIVGAAREVEPHEKAAAAQPSVAEPKSAPLAKPKEAEAEEVKPPATIRRRAARPEPSVPPDPAKALARPAPVPEPSP